MEMGLLREEEALHNLFSFFLPLCLPSPLRVRGGGAVSLAFFFFLLLALPSYCSRSASLRARVVCVSSCSKKQACFVACKVKGRETPRVQPSPVSQRIKKAVGHIKRKKKEADEKGRRNMIPINILVDVARSLFTGTYVLSPSSPSSPTSSLHAIQMLLNVTVNAKKTLHSMAFFDPF